MTRTNSSGSGLGLSQERAGHSQQSQAPVHVRLYHEKDERRRRLEEARLRKLEQEEEDIRAAAQRALGRAPSPAGAAHHGHHGGSAPPMREASPQGRALHTATGSRGHATPPRMRPPLPERPQAATGGGGGGVWTGGSGGGGGGHGRRSPQPQRAVAAEEVPVRHAPHMAHTMRGHANEVDTSPAVAQQQPPSPVGASPGHGVLAQGDSSNVSITSEGIQGASVGTGTYLGEDSLCGDAMASTAAPSMPEDAQSLRQMVATQQQRIEFLENMHQQALRQLRKSREELAKAQQQRFHEADKVLRLEQLVSEMQAQRFDGDAQAQLRWEEWLSRSRAIFEEE